MDRAEIERIAQSAAGQAGHLINAAEGLALMKRCVDEGLGSVTVTQRQCDSLIWMISLLRSGSNG